MNQSNQYEAFLRHTRTRQAKRVLFTPTSR